MTTRPLRILALAGLLATSALAPAAAQAPTFDIARIANDIKILASDEFEGRGPATPAEKKTIDYIAAQMKAAGLEPAGGKGGWFQDVPLRKSEIEYYAMLAKTGVHHFQAALLLRSSSTGSILRHVDFYALRDVHCGRTLRTYL